MSMKPQEPVRTQKLLLFVLMNTGENEAINYELQHDNFYPRFIF
jgi:hypothetical protein